MPTEVLNSEALNELVENKHHSYLHIATVAGKSALNFFYIGENTHSLKSLEDCFHNGYAAKSLEEARLKIQSMDLAENRIDVFFIDLPYNPVALKGFLAFLSVIESIGGHVPVIYNESHFRDGSVTIDCNLIDDIIDIANWQFDFTRKVSFLKKVKENMHASVATVEKIRPKKYVIKRVFDILASLVLLIMLLPVMLLIALVIKLESKGPVFYNAKRAGRGFRIFKFYKFRTMVVNADKKIQDLAHLNQYAGAANGARFFKLSNDPRVTRIGRFLRNTSLDELPQLFNVLKGDMSLVGNRPLPLYEAATLTTNEFVERFMAPAGITGLWQIKKRGKAEMSIEERISLDIDYARKFNLLYDFWIMANTPGALLQKSNV